MFLPHHPVEWWLLDIVPLTFAHSRADIGCIQHCAHLVATSAVAECSGNMRNWKREHLCLSPVLPRMSLVRLHGALALSWHMEAVTLAELCEDRTRSCLWNRLENKRGPAPPCPLGSLKAASQWHRVSWEAVRLSSEKLARACAVPRRRH